MKEPVNDNSEKITKIINDIKNGQISQTEVLELTASINKVIQLKKKVIQLREKNPRDMQALSTALRDFRAADRIKKIFNEGKTNLFNNTGLRYTDFIGKDNGEAFIALMEKKEL